MLTVRLIEEYISYFDHDPAHFFGSQLNISVDLNINRKYMNLEIATNISMRFVNDLIGKVQLEYNEEQALVQELAHEIRSTALDDLSVDKIESIILDFANNLNLNDFKYLKKMANGDVNESLLINKDFVCKIPTWNSEEKIINGKMYRFFYEPKVDGIQFGVWESEYDDFYYIDKGVVLKNNILKPFVKEEV